MFEKVNPSHPDKIADRIAGAVVDLAYSKTENPKVACEVLIGHGECNIINETSQHLEHNEVQEIVNRIVGKNILLHYLEVPQDKFLAKNQEKSFRCGDNGIFKGVPISLEEQKLVNIAHMIYDKYKSDGKYIYDNNKNRLIICQSNADISELSILFPEAEINPLGNWTGGINVDTGATNRKLGSDMGRAATGGGLHGKDLSKADVSVNIFCWLMAQEFNQTIECNCAIGDEKIGIFSFKEIVNIARKYINHIGGFEKFAEWGLIR